MVVKLGKGEVVSLAKSAGLLTIRLEWSTATDVDVACLYVHHDGTKGVVQALGRRFGSLTAAPYIKLDGDALNGGVETMSINLDHAKDFSRVLAFAYIYRGGWWGRVRDARVTVTHPTQGTYEFELKGTNWLTRWFRTVALIELTDNGDELRLAVLDKYFIGAHQSVDRKYGYGLNWKPGSK